MQSNCKRNHSGSKEVWKDVPGYEGLYQVSNMGRVKSLDRYVPTRWGTPTFRKGVMLKPKYSCHGYAIVSLCKKGEIKDMAIHRIVLETFVGSCLPGQQCRHLDTDTRNNQLKNLCWGTQQEDWNDRRKYGKVHLGERHWSNKLTEEQVKEIRNTIRMTNMFAAKFGISKTLIKSIRKRKVWKWLK